MADFSHIQSIQTVVPQASSSSIVDCDTRRKASLQLKVAGSTELLTINCPSLHAAENMADLIDGYCRLVNNLNPIDASSWP